MVILHCLLGWYQLVLPSFLLGLGCFYSSSNQQSLLKMGQCKIYRREQVIHLAQGYIHCIRLYCKHAYRLSADLIVKRFLLLLLEFSPPSFFPITCPTLFASEELRWTFGSPEDAMGFPFTVEGWVTCTVWKNFCRAVWVFWAEAVQVWECWTGLEDFGPTLIGADSTEDTVGGASRVFAAQFDETAELENPVLTSAFKVQVL